MKKMIMALSMMIVFISCVNSQENNSSSSGSNSKTTHTNLKESKMKKTIELTKESFSQKVVNLESTSNEWKYLGDKPAIVDFYADWCGPCRSIAPILEELAEEYDGQIYIYKVNTQEEQEIAAAFQIRSIPSLLFIPMKGQPQMAQGALPKSTFKQAIEEVLLNNKE